MLLADLMNLDSEHLSSFDAPNEVSEVTNNSSNEMTRFPQLECCTHMFPWSYELRNRQVKLTREAHDLGLP